MPITGPLDGYVYGYQDTNTGNQLGELLDQFEPIVSLANNWTEAVSSDQSNSPELYNNLKSQLKIIYDRVTTIVDGIAKGIQNPTSEDSYPTNWYVQYALAPPGNIYWEYNEGPNDVQHISPGALWNAWAASYTLQQINNNVPNANDYWDSEIASKFEDSFGSSPPPRFHVVRQGNTHPSNDHSRYNPNDLDYTYPVAAGPTEALHALYDFKNIMPTYLENAIKQTAAGFTYNSVDYQPLTIEKRPSLQDMVYFQYALTGEGMLQQELGGATDKLTYADQILTGLNLLNKVLSADIDVNRSLIPTAAAKTGSLWDTHTYLLSGWSMLNCLRSDGYLEAAGSNTSAIGSVLGMFKSSADKVRSYVNAKTEANKTNAQSAIFNLWLGKVAGNTKTEINKVTTAVNSAVSNYENLNDTLKQDIKQSVYIYQEFVKSATTILKKFQTIVKNMSQNIRS